ncbi:MAG: heterodisulfide reductase-related iron-sulfur binding cluster [Dehalococcoidia bacterium]
MMRVHQQAHAHDMRPSLADDIARCVHCGFCLQACPTYLELGMETDSPRGRIALIDAVASHRAEPTPSLLKHLDQCLQCRACETACPSGVQFGRIMETARADVLESPKRPLSWRLRVAALRQVLPHQSRIRTLMTAMRVYERSPLRKLVQRTGALRRVAPSLADAEQSMPHVPSERFRPSEQPEGLTKSVAMLTGCVMPHLYARTHEATVRVLNRLGYRVIMAADQTCCGALNVHAGDRRFARELAKRNIDAMLREDIEAIVVNSAGCGSTMKEYGDLLADDAEYAARAARFASMTRDLLEFIAVHDLGDLGAVPRVVTYQDSCHLVHAQRIAAAPRTIMSQIPALELREIASPDRCCGSAGLYSIVQGDLSRRLLGSKMDDVERTGAAIVATANPGCMMQLEAGFRSREIRGQAVHVIELLDESMRAAAPR